MCFLVLKEMVVWYFHLQWEDIFKFLEIMTSWSSFFKDQKLNIALPDEQ